MYIFSIPNIDSNTAIWLGILVIFVVVCCYYMFRPSKKKKVNAPAKTNYDFNLLINKELAKAVEEFPDQSYGKILMMLDIVQTGQNNGKIYTKNPSSQNSAAIYAAIKATDLNALIKASMK